MDIMHFFHKSNYAKRVKTPVILQMENVECGAVTLASILAYYGHRAPLEKIRIACDVSRDGCNAENLLKVAREYGLDTEAYSIEINELSDFKAPFIIHWEFNHFVIYEGRDKDGFYINDPALGYRKISYADFDNKFTGIILTFSPNQSFKKTSKHHALKQIISTYTQDAYKGIVFLFITGLLLSIPAFLLPIFSKIFVDNILIQKMNSWLFPFVIGMLCIAIGTALVTWLEKTCILRFCTKIGTKTTTNFFWHLLHLPCQFFFQRWTGDIINRIHLNQTNANLVIYNVSTFMVEIMKSIVVVGLLFYYNATLACLVLSLTFINLMIKKQQFEYQKLLNNRLLAEESKLYGVELNGLSLIQSLKSNASESLFFSKWVEAKIKFITTLQILSKSYIRGSTAIELLTSITFITVLIVGAYKIIESQITIGTLVAFQGLSLILINSVNQFIQVTNHIQELTVNSERIRDIENFTIDEVFTHKTRPIETIRKNKAGKLLGHIVFDKVTFGYRNLSPPLIDELSFEVLPGQRVALVGSSGSGKSTIAKLALQIYRPWSGNIYIDGVPIEEIDPILLRHSLSMVSQDIYIFNDTIKNNLTLWDNTVSEISIKEAAQDALIHQEISSRQGAYLSEITEGGNNFSGGQKQRLELARALATNPSILILDEATSALDQDTEEKIYMNLNRRNVTVINIAHRLSTIKNSDKIFVMQDGRLVEEGTHDYLILKGGYYAKLVSAI